MDQKVIKSDKGSFVPKNLFDNKESLKLPVQEIIKEEQKINIVGGKKRITPILLSPKKKFKLIAERKSREKSSSPEMVIGCEGTSLLDD